MGSLLAMLGGFSAFCIGWWLLVRRRYSIVKILFPLIVTLFLLSVIIMPPGSIPDEDGHIQTAYRYSNVLLFKPYSTDDAGIWARAVDAPLKRFSRYATPYLDNYREIAQNWQWFCPSEGSVLVEDAGRNASCGFIAYLPAAIGLTLARLLHLGTWPMIYLGRLCNVAAFAFLLYWAVKIAPFKKYFFLMMGLVPTCIQAAGSFSYDGPIIGLSLLLTAYFLRLVFVVPKITWKEWFLCCAAAFLMFPCKFIYSTIFFVLLFIPKEKLGGMPKKVLFLACVIIIGIVGFISGNINQLFAYMKTLDGSARANELTYLEVYSVGWILSHPLEVFQMMLRAMRANFTFYLEGVFISRLTRFDLRLGWAFILLICYLLMAMQDEKDTIVLSGKQRLTCIIGFSLTFVAAFMAMLVDYTPVGSDQIVGVQGRYFVPVLPLLAMGLSTTHIRLDDHLKRWIASIVIGCNGGVMCDLLYWIVVNQINMG